MCVCECMSVHAHMYVCAARACVPLSCLDRGDESISQGCCHTEIEIADQTFLNRELKWRALFVGCFMSQQHGNVQERII